MPLSRIARLRAILDRSSVARYALLSSVAQMVIQLILETGVAVMHNNELALVSDAYEPALAAAAVKDATTGLSALPATDPRMQLYTAYNLARALFVYHIIYMLATCLQLFFTFDSILHQNSVELVALNTINLGLFGYSLMQFFQSVSTFNALNDILALPALLKSAAPTAAAAAKGLVLKTTSIFHIPSMVVSLLFLAGGAAATYKLHHDFGWAIYKRIGANIGLRRQMMHYFFLMMLLKLDIFFYSTFSLQFLVIQTFADAPMSNTIIHVGVSFIMIFVLVILCMRGVRSENARLMQAFMVGTVGCMGYLAYKLWQATTEARFEPVKRSILFSIVVCLILALATLVNSFICYRNFGTGLKEHVSRQASVRRRREREQQQQQLQHQHLAGSTASVPSAAAYAPSPPQPAAAAPTAAYAQPPQQQQVQYQQHYQQQAPPPQQQQQQQQSAYHQATAYQQTQYSNGGSAYQQQSSSSGYGQQAGGNKSGGTSYA
ncbi:hypothetical protein H9P43_002208 [Blastocladiella emersonii ATCC 22665]|nr:hypothetical protein H9P43_002208 [Blastocladiella emersonii ATCC 22665]